MKGRLGPTFYKFRVPWGEMLILLVEGERLLFIFMQIDNERDEKYIFKKSVGNG